MKKLVFLVAIIVVGLMFTACEKNFVEDPANDLQLKSSKNDKLTGFDEWGFNWNAHQFKGYTINMMFGDHFFMYYPHYKKYVYKGEGPDFWDMVVSEFSYFPMLMPGELLESKLLCRWNEALISSEGEYPAGWMDTDAWIVFNYSGEIEGKHWKSMRKLVAAKSTDQLVEGVWYNEQGDEIGLDALFWTDLIVVQVVNNGEVPPFPFFYSDYNSPNGPGYGEYKLKR
jgi:hypothetical protein